MIVIDLVVGTYVLVPLLSGLLQRGFAGVGHVHVIEVACTSNIIAVCHIVFLLPQCILIICSVLVFATREKLLSSLSRDQQFSSLDYMYELFVQCC